MELFESERQRNLLPYQGIVTYYGTILAKSASDNLLKILLEDIPWKNDEAIIYGKHIITKRKVAWFGDSDYEYTYSNTTKKALPWTKELSELKSLTEEITETKFNSCLLNLYNNGEEGMAWHSDDEKALGKNSVIASLSFGAERKFYFKHKSTKEQISLILEHGSLLVMRGAQESWLHSLPKTKSIKQPRINLTFRTMRY
ncbi:alpha-ketoglutarate-dependent dioxygenase AlkB [Leptospira selangorensis]|uniref:Alpha-ketoglutarate-dependent dioxygenase AlkB n=1 Tax=Leptospira selangorensis TaxID=2484982 RepID=A0A5F2BWB7_9LEPT|nr:alpha-ketoglutarate-dependent dioxygenase AlkB [Leptospira selangorensis]TGM13198.1 alpha-ketoglutarate-dependent dioxygenase AlkB [Leptospira selangorensis]TGM15336.1 alpha-ketoglutarate-dependent dioxygenase AlkB [Leptospira selangorensis]